VTGSAAVSEPLTGLIKLDPSDDQAIADVMELGNAALAVDEPDEPPVLFTLQAGVVRYGWDGEPAVQWLYRDGTGKLIGKFKFFQPGRENLHLTGIEVLVHPAHRRRGLGTRLHEQALRMARESGRRLLTTETIDAPGPVAFAEKLGFQRGGSEIQRRQDLSEVDLAQVEALRKQAAEVASDYRLLRIAGAVPSELIDSVAVLTAAINDAPTDDMDVEDHVYNADRIRAFERAQAGWGRKLYRLIAQRISDGALAGHTILAVDPERPEWGDQYDTSVLKEHRGHRLGLLLKASMLEWMAEAEPELRYVDTWNAESNAHMIGINEQLGYRVVRRYLNWQLDLS
jgi:GNAT superfamily N-acetyltransferase